MFSLRRGGFILLILSKLQLDFPLRPVGLTKDSRPSVVSRRAAPRHAAARLRVSAYKKRAGPTPYESDNITNRNETTSVGWELGLQVFVGSGCIRVQQFDVNRPLLRLLVIRGELVIGDQYQWFTDPHDLSGLNVDLTYGSRVDT